MLNLRFRRHTEAPDLRATEAQLRSQRLEDAHEHKTVRTDRRYRRAAARWAKRAAKHQVAGDRRGYRPSARETFELLRPILLQSRPVVGTDRHGKPIFGAPTFRNVLEDGELK